ncbi:ATP-binding protein [Endozoicomonas ascidiicola]|uniref:ATP-binding protein n=1 Tax=Endozoicomonas ascidiicola TaxID=1698521 RepID=UPI00082EA4E3|nr:ATP-binding protein [Endozoicomonas ascidiicola]
MPDETGHSLKLQIDSELSNTALVAMAVRGLCTMTTLSPVEVNRVELCIVEIVNNAIEHAYDSEKGHKVEVGVDLLQSKLQFTVSDWGKSLDESKLDEKEELDVDGDNPASWLCSGRGLSIVQNLMDQIDYQCEGDKNSFIMSKQIRE